MIARRLKRRSDHGFVSIEILLAVSFSLIFLMFLVNLLFIQYSRGVVRTAADEGARAGGQIILVGSTVSNAEAINLCQKRAMDALTTGIGGFANSPTANCALVPGGGQIRANVSVRILPWLPPPLGFTQDLTGVAHSVKEGL